MNLPKILNRAVQSFCTLPGVGEKTAFRQVLHISRQKDELIKEFGDSMKDLAKLKKCGLCGMYAEDDRCEICLSEKRKKSRIICVVENIMDCLAIEKSGYYCGLYHILGGVLNPLLGIGPDELDINKLTQRIMNHDIKELILAINPSVEGDATCSYIKQIVPEDVAVDRIGFGMPIGGSLEYLDGMTISKALENKKRL